MDVDDGLARTTVDILEERGELGVAEVEAFVIGQSGDTDAAKGIEALGQVDVGQDART